MTNYQTNLNACCLSATKVNNQEFLACGQYELVNTLTTNRIGQITLYEVQGDL